jgi:diguanylate cyclase (GGDEF)-like protein/PAS domain S-box-containing protein
MKQTIFRDRHLYVLLALFVVSIVFYYFGELVDVFGWEALRWDILYTVHDPHRMLFLAPILYASYCYRLRGALLANAVTLLIFLPRAFFISPYPDATLRMVVFIVVVVVISILIVLMLNERDKRNQTTDALTHLEEKNRSVLEQMYDSYYETDLSGKFTFVNNSVCRDLGYTREEMIGKNYRLTVPEDDINAAVIAFEEVFRTREPNHGLEHRTVCKDGSIIFVESSISLRKNEKGEVIGFRSISRDVTERKQAEEGVRVREAHLQSLVNILQYNAVSVQDFLDNALNEAIKLTESKIGYIYYYDEGTKEFTLNTWSKDVMDECTIAEKKTQYHLDKTGIWGEAVRQRKPIVVNDFMAPHHLKKGYPEGHAKLYKYLTVPVIMDDRIVAVIGVANKASDYIQTDILQLTLLMNTVWKATYSKQIEVELRQSEELYRSLFENMLNGFAYCKMLFEQDKPRDFIYLSVNEAFEKQTGLKDVTGRKVSEVIPGIQESDPQLIETYGRVAINGIPETLEMYLAALDMWFSISIYSPQKEYFVAIFDVITERKRAEHLVAQQMNELKAFYSLADIASKEGITLDDLCQEVANTLPASWQYPEIAYARIIIGDREFCTDNFRASAWNQSAPVKVHGTVEGRIDVGYLEERPQSDEGPFLKEERRLINAIAERMGRIAERKQAEDAQRESEEKYRTLVENINDVFLTLDNQGNITYVSPVVERITRYNAGDLTGKPFTPLIYPDDLPALLESFNRLISGQLEPSEFRIVDKDGRLIYVRTSSRPVYEDGKAVGITTLMTDITEHKQAEVALREAEEKYRSLVENINDIFYILDNRGNITYISPVVERLTLYKVSELVGKPIIQIIHPDDLPALLESYNHLVDGQLAPWEYRLLDKDGRNIFVHASRQLLYKGGKITGVTAVLTDITERKQMEQKLEEMATHDNLTGLPNRLLLADRFRIAAALAHRNKARLAVMSLDLDKFKTINDTLGHDAGDHVLKTVSKRITGIIRASDTLARVGGDEFILVMLETNHAQDSSAIAQKILDSFAEPLSIDGHNVELSTSIGIAVYPEDAEDIETLLKKSDAAMYFSKGHGRNRYKFFSDGNVSVGGDHKSAGG